MPRLWLPSVSNQRTQSQQESSVDHVGVKTSPLIQGSASPAACRALGTLARDRLTVPLSIRLGSGSGLLRPAVASGSVGVSRPWRRSVPTLSSAAYGEERIAPHGVTVLLPRTAQERYRTLWGCLPPAPRLCATQSKYAPVSAPCPNPGAQSLSPTTATEYQWHLTVSTSICALYT